MMGGAVYCITVRIAYRLAIASTTAHRNLIRNEDDSLPASIYLRKT